MALASCPAFAFVRATNAAAGSQASAEPKPTAPIILSMRDVAGFSGGQDLDLDAEGNLFVRIARHDPDHSEARFWERRFHLKLQPAELSQLIAFVRTSGIARYRERRRNGVPDEARPSVRVALPRQATIDAAKWDNDKDPNFDTLYKRLLELVDRTSKTPSYREQPYDFRDPFP